MIMFWNQKEVFVGNSSQKFNEVRRVLEANKIVYKYRMVNNGNAKFFSSRRARIGTFGENKDYSTMYYVYVHKDGYEIACAVLNNS